jgi:hypothetical protein
MLSAQTSTRTVDRPATSIPCNHSAIKRIRANRSRSSAKPGASQWSGSAKLSNSSSECRSVGRLDIHATSAPLVHSMSWCFGSCFMPSFVACQRMRSSGEATSSASRTSGRCLSSRNRRRGSDVSVPSFHGQSSVANGSKCVHNTKKPESTRCTARITPTLSPSGSQRSVRSHPSALQRGRLLIRYCS